MLEKNDQILAKYQDYIPEKRFREPTYHKFINEPIMENGLLLLSRNYESGLETAKYVVEKLKDSNIKIYVREYYRDIFADLSYVEAIETDSDDFFRANAVCRYIYAENKLIPTFLKRKGQIVFNNVTEFPNITSVKNRTNLSVLCNKTDYFLGDFFEEPDMDIDGFIEYIKKGRTDRPSRKKSNKKELLIAVNLNLYNADALLDAALRYCKNINFKKYDVTLLFGGIFMDEYIDILKRFPKKVKLAAKYTFILGDEETNKCITFLCKEWKNLKSRDISVLSKKLPPNFFANESLRILGKQRYDIVVNMGYFSFYWDNIIKLIAKKCYFVDDYQSSSPNKEYLTYRLNYLCSYTKAFVLNKRMLDFYGELNKHRMKNINIIQLKSHKKFLPDEVESIVLDGENYFVLLANKNKKFDFINMYLCESFEGSKDYMVLDNNLDDIEASELIEKAIRKYKDIIIFDFYSVLSQAKKNDIINNGVNIILNPAIYYSIFDKLKTSIIKKDGRLTYIFKSDSESNGKAAVYI